jgi:hypothetical protein
VAFLTAQGMGPAAAVREASAWAATRKIIEERERCGSYPACPLEPVRIEYTGQTSNPMDPGPLFASLGGSATAKESDTLSGGSLGRILAWNDWSFHLAVRTYSVGDPGNKWHLLVDHEDHAWLQWSQREPLPALEAEGELRRVMHSLGVPEVRLNLFTMH